MELNVIIPVITTALTVGLGCGACCSPILSVFLSTYVISHADGVKRGAVSFASFFLGKAISVSLMCMAAAVLSRQFIAPDGYIDGFNLRLFAQIVMSCIGLVLAIRWFIDNRRKKGCNDCYGCDSPKPVKRGIWPMFSAGLTYGFTPCAPLLLMIGYSFTLPVALAGVNGVAFSLASAVSPVLLLAVITGALSKKMKQEIPQYTKWFQLISYLFMIVMPFIIKSY